MGDFYPTYTLFFLHPGVLIVNMPQIHIRLEALPATIQQMLKEAGRLLELFVLGGKGC